MPVPARSPRAPLILVSLVALLLGGCISGRGISPDKDRKYSVLFVGPAAQAAQPAIFFDRDGDIYPDFPTPLTDDQMRNLDPAGTLTLKALFQRVPEAREAIFRELNINPAGLGSDALWAQVQRKLLEREVSQIQSALRGGSKILVVLIHGFNNNYADALDDNEAAKKRIASLYPAREFVFLELYWNGFSKSGGVGIWAVAQHNSTVTGPTLRALLNAVPAGIPVRILTHSRGAAVAAAALWNIDATIPAGYKRGDPDGYSRMVERRAGIPTPRPNLRVLMLAPAMSSLTFKDYYQRPAGSAALPYERIIVGQNKRDSALNKYGLGRMLRSWGGATDAGYSASSLALQIDDLKTSRDPNIAVVDFSGDAETRTALIWEDHGFKAYLNRSAFPRALAQLIE